MNAADLIVVTDDKGFITLHEPNEDGEAGDLVASVWRDDWLATLRPSPDAIREALEDVILGTTVGKPGSMALRSRYASYPAHLYHKAKAALATPEGRTTDKGEGK